jgi:ParB family protein of integrating conjugative element (PFGI_1 class)
MNRKTVSLGSAMLQRGRQAPAVSALPPPVSEMPMVLTLDELRPNPDNPRTSRNPKYDDIKASVRARGLDTVPKVTRDPAGEAVYIFSDGGNTRYQILSELWQETGEERFYRLHCLFKPWPGRLQCVIGHLAENEVRGDLSFIEKALGIQKARAICEEQMEKKISLRELSRLLTEQGLPVHNSSISRMDDTVKYLYPWMPALLGAGLGRPQIQLLLSLRQDAEQVWQQYMISADPAPEQAFMDVFGACCRKFDAPELWSGEMFRDELIGDLLRTLPHPALNYDRWLLELNPAERSRRKTLGDTTPLPELPADGPAPVAAHPIPPERSSGSSPALAVTPAVAAPGDNARIAALSPEPPEVDSNRPVVRDVGMSATCPPTLRIELQPDLYGGAPVLSGDEPEDDIAEMLSGEGILPASSDPQEDDAVPAFAATGLEPVRRLWHIPALHDDIEHLQAMAFRLAFELAESQGCDACVLPDSGPVRAAGYCLAPSFPPPAFGQLLQALIHPEASPSSLTLSAWLTGTAAPDGAPGLDEVHAVKFLRLIRVLRRLRELQRALPDDDGADDTEGDTE